jgi:hypothetical protein
MKSNRIKNLGVKRSLALATLATLASVAVVPSVQAGNPAPNPDWTLGGVELDGTANWLLTGGILDEPSVGARDDNGAALDVLEDEDATIGEGASWNLDLEDEVAIRLADESTLTLNGDLTVTTNHDNDDSPVLLSGAVDFVEDGTLTGDGNIVMSNAPTNLGSKDGSLITVGLSANDSLNILGYDGAITVTNDNSNSTSEGNPLDGESSVDLSGSAIALGVAAPDLGLDSENPAGIEEILGAVANFGISDIRNIYDAFVDFDIEGAIDQVITVTALSRDENSVDGSGEDVQSLSAAVAAGVVGENLGTTGKSTLASGIVEDAVITVVATSGVSIVEGGQIVGDTVEAEIESASVEPANIESDSIAMAVGFAGATSKIEGNAIITAEATSALAISSINDSSNKIARAHSIASAAAVLGDVANDISGSESVGVTIAGEATAGDAIVKSYNDSEELEFNYAGNFAEGTSIAMAAGLAGSTGIHINDGVIGEIENASISATATSGQATSEQVGGNLYNPVYLDEATAESIAAAAAIVGDVGDIFSASITASAVSGETKAEGLWEASANSTALAGGVLGTAESIAPEPIIEFEKIEGLPFSSAPLVTITAAATAGDSIADSAVLATANSTARAYGVGNIELFADELDSLSFIVEEFVADEEVIFNDPIDSGEVAASAVNGAVNASVELTATGADATADADIKLSDDFRSEEFPTTSLADATADALTTGIAGDVDGPVAGSFTQSAEAGTAHATADGLELAVANALANADSTGIDGKVDGTVSAIFNLTAAGDSADAVADAVDQAVAIAASTAYTTGIYVGETNPAMTGSFTQVATGGTANATARGLGQQANTADEIESEHVEGTEFAALAYANAEADSTGIYGIVAGDVSSSFDLTAIGGTATAKGYSQNEGDSDDHGNAEALAYAYSGGIFVDEGDAVDGDVEGAVFTQVATGGTAKAVTEVEGDAYSYADADGESFGIDGGVDGDVKDTKFYLTATGGGLGHLTAAIATAESSYGAAEVETYASAESYGVNGDVSGDVVESEFDLDAFGGSAIANATAALSAPASARAEAYAESNGIFGSVGGFIDESEFKLIAEGGEANVSAESSDGAAEAYADAYGVSAGIGGTVGGAVSADFNLTTTGGEANASAESSDGAAYSEADADGENYGIDGSVDGTVSAVFDLTATGGTANADATGSDETIAIADANAYSTSIVGDVNATNGGGEALTDALTGSFTQVSTGGAADAAADSSDGVAIATANAWADSIGVDGFVLGTVSADFDLTASGGTAEANAEGEGNGEDNGEAIANADASTTGIYAVSEEDAVAQVDPIEGIISADNGIVLTGSFTQVAEGGTAHAVATSDEDIEAEAYAVANSTGFNGDFFGTVLANIADDVDETVLTNFDLTANGGNATATAESSEEAEADADASATTAGINGEVTGVDGVALNGFFRQVAEGGTAIAEADALGHNASSADAKASAESTGVNGDVLGSVSSFFGLTATGGEARASMKNASDGSDDGDAVAEAKAVVTGILRSVVGNLEGDFEQVALGGTAIAVALATDEVDADAAADADANNYGVKGDVTGDVDANFDLTTSGGSASANAESAAGAATANASADVESSAMHGTSESLFTGNINSEFTDTATGGEAVAIAVALNDATAKASADVESTGVNGQVDGNVDSTFNLTATGGSADANAESSDSAAEARADAGARSTGIDGDVGEIDDSEFILAAEGGSADANAESSDSAAEARADAGARSTGIDDDVVEIDDSYFNVDVLGGSADASAVASGAEGDVGVYASADGESIGIDGTVESVEDSEFNIDAEGGSVDATATLLDGSGSASANAYARGNSTGIDDDVAYVDDSVFNIYAEGGSADATAILSNSDADPYAYAYAYAGARSYGIDGEGGDVNDSEFNIYAEGGRADAVATLSDNHGGSQADADAASTGIEEDVESVEDSEFNIYAEGGSADASAISSGLFTSASANAYAKSDGIDADSDVESVEGSGFNVAAEGGSAVATATSSDGDGAAYANSYANSTGIDVSVSEIDDSEFILAAEGGSADVTATSSDGDAFAAANSYANSTGIDGSGSVEDSNFDLSAIGGTATAYAASTGVVPDVSEGAEDEATVPANANANAYANARVYGIGNGIQIPEDSSSNALYDSSLKLRATGGIAVVETAGPDGSSTADAKGVSYGVNGDIVGDVDDTIFDLKSTGGTAVARGVIDSSQEALASGRSTAILGAVTGDFWAEMTVVAEGGTAIIESTYELDGFSSADASAIASGIDSGSEDSALIGEDLDGSISVTASAGTAAYLSGYSTDDLYLDASAEAVAVRGSVYDAYEDEGINYDYTDVDADITARAVGGTVVMQGDLISEVDAIDSDAVDYPFDASAFAAGIFGRAVDAAVNGDIIAIATPGVVGTSAPAYAEKDTIEASELAGPVIPEIPELGDDVYLGKAFAVGIMADRANTSTNLVVRDGIDSADIIEGVGIPSGLNLDIQSKVHAFVTAPEGYELDLGNSYAAAVYGADAADFVDLYNGAEIIGDINLGDGENELTVLGNTIMEGNILSTSRAWISEWLDQDNGSGTIDFDIENGLFTAVRTVNVSDLENTLNIAAAGGLAPILSQTATDGHTSLISVRGTESDVTFAEGARILPVFAVGVDLNKVMGNAYTIVDTNGSITDNGAVVDNTFTPFDYSVEIVNPAPEATVTDQDENIESSSAPINTYVLTVDKAKDVDGKTTPGVASSGQAGHAATQVAMTNTSQHVAKMRSALISRDKTPEGALGPDAELLRSGVWQSYISVFGNIGSQDTSNGSVGFDYDTNGLLMGQEKLVGEQLIVGIAGAYAMTDVSGSSGSGGGDSTLYSGTLYANWFSETWYVEGGLTYGHAENDVTRVDYKGDRYAGEYDTALVGTWIETGYRASLGDFGVEPYGRLTYVHGENEGFTDAGPDSLVLTTRDNESDNFKTELGMRLNRQWIFQDRSSFIIEAKAGWEREWADQGVSLNANYLGAILDVESAEADEDALVLGLRAEWANGSGFSVGFEYEPTLAGNWYNHAFSGTLRYEW